MGEFSVLTAIVLVSMAAAEDNSSQSFLGGDDYTAQIKDFLAPSVPSPLLLLIFKWDPSFMILARISSRA